MSPEPEVPKGDPPESAVDSDAALRFLDPETGADLMRRPAARYGRFFVAALGSLPWVGGFFSASASLHAEIAQGRHNELFRRWLEEHRERLQRLGRSLTDVVERLDQLGPEIEARLESEEYLDVVRKAFRAWDDADTDEKRGLITKLVTNAAATSVCSDDVVRLFVDWIRTYHEIHFAVIGTIYRDPGTTRAAIWNAIGGKPVREDSAEADLFRLLVRDLSVGGVIRQHRGTTASGEFLKKRRSKRRGSVLASAFDDQEPYELTELGRQFVHYAMTDLVPRIGATPGGARTPPVNPEAE